MDIYVFHKRKKTVCCILKYSGMHFCTRQTNQPKQCFGNLHWHCPFFFLEIKIYKIWLSCLAIYYTIEIIPGARKLLLNCYFNLFWTSLQNTNLFAFHLELLINFTQLVCKPLRNLNTVIINISLFHFLCNLVNWFSPLKTVKKKWTSSSFEPWLGSFIRISF